MKRTGPVLTRLVLLALAVGGGYFAYTRYSPSLINSSPAANKILGQVEGATSNLNINFSPLLHAANEKLVQKQAIVETPSSQVKGDSTSVDLGQTAQSVAQSAASQISTQLQNLPKQEAAKVLRQTCDQIATELEK